MAHRIRYLVTETLLWVAAALGLVAVVLVFCAYFFNISIILFRTGSMEPTIPAGSAALVQEIEASKVEVGDVLTVDRPGEMPVTHRVTSIQPGDTSAERVITMQGDANESADPAPYTITEGRVLLGSVPGLANPINQLGNPYVMGGITVAASVLVGWAFWPKNTGGSGPSKPRHKAGKQTPESHKPRHAGATVVGAAAVATAAIAWSPHTAYAVTEPAGVSEVVREIDRSDYITLTSEYAPATRQNLSPGVTSAWDIGIEIDAPTEGQVLAGLSASGSFPLELTILACSTRWDPGTLSSDSHGSACPGGHRVVEEELLVTAGEDIRVIDEFHSEDAPWLRLLVGLPDGDQVPPEGTVGLIFHVQAWEDELSTGAEIAPGDGKTSGSSDKTIDDDADHAPKEGAAPPGESQAPEDGDLARTGFALLPLLVAAILSVLLGRWLKSRSSQSSDAKIGGAAL